ncbi:MAG: polysaccharide deacetylase family protein [Pirellulaceae bacterium]
MTVARNDDQSAQSPRANTGGLAYPELRVRRERSSSRRTWLQAATVAGLLGPSALRAAQPAPRKARIAITLDLEMSREYPRRDILEWDYEKGNLDEATKRYAVEAARVAKDRGGLIHFFCVGRVLEQPDVAWLKEIAAAGHPIGNHTYDHVYVLAQSVEEVQFRFRRAPWLVAGQTVPQIIRQNIAMTTAALDQRCGIRANGFRTPGGFADGIAGRADLQRLLLELGFRWCSSKYPPPQMGSPRTQPTDAILDGIVRTQAAAQPFVYPSGLLEIPMSPVSDVNAFRSNYWKLPWFLTAIERAVKWAIQESAVFDFLAHPSCLVVEDPSFESIKLICDLVRDAGERAELCGLDGIAAAYGAT